MGDANWRRILFLDRQNDLFRIEKIFSCDLIGENLLTAYIGRENASIVFQISVDFFTPQ